MRLLERPVPALLIGERVVAEGLPHRVEPLLHVLGKRLAREVVRRFREWVRPGAEAPFFERIGVATWYREPDFAPNYRSLWALEQELSDEGAAQRFELLSIWRLARDESYAPWARSIGTQACQISFFGLQENTDWFTQRRGAFRDSLLATERLRPDLVAMLALVSLVLLGLLVAAAGDVNGDGFADVLVSAPYFHAGQADEGKVLVYHGAVDLSVRQDGRVGRNVGCSLALFAHAQPRCLQGQDNPGREAKRW